MQMNFNKWRLSHHAVSRMREMRLSQSEVAELLETPGIVADQDRRSKYRDTGNKLYMRGNYTAVVALSEEGPHTVVTFLYRYKDGWRDSQPTQVEGREYRPWSTLPDNPDA